MALHESNSLTHSDTGGMLSFFCSYFIASLVYFLGEEVQLTLCSVGVVPEEVVNVRVKVVTLRCDVCERTCHIRGRCIDEFRGLNAKVQLGEALTVLVLSITWRNK